MAKLELRTTEEVDDVREAPLRLCQPGDVAERGPVVSDQPRPCLTERQQAAGGALLLPQEDEKEDDQEQQREDDRPRPPEVTFPLAIVYDDSPFGKLLAHRVVDNADRAVRVAERPLVRSASHGHDVALDVDAVDLVAL